MIRLRLLGSPAVESRSRAEASEVLRKPKRFALLAYLAAAKPRGFHRRDTLIALLWPEFDQQRARAALNRTLYELRRELGEDAVLSHGNEEVGLGPSVWCDVVAFDEALERGNRFAALDLYRGDMLQGFYVPGVPEFERWVERERSRLRELAVQAALELSETLDDAVRWARRACEIDPDDERVLRRLLVTLDATGDRSAALREYEAFARTLAREYDALPSPETQALVEAIRRREAELVPHADAPAPGDPPGDARVPEATAPAELVAETPVSDPEPSPSPIRGRRASDILALILICAVAIGAFALFRTPAPAPSASSPVVSVLPFEYRGDPSLSYLGEGLASLVTANLTGLPGVESTDARALLAALEQRSEDTRVRAPREAAAVASRLGANYFVLGDVVEAGGRIRVNAALHSVQEPGTPVAAASVEGGPDEVFDQIDVLALRLFRGIASRSSRFSGVSDATRSLAALEAYVNGEQALRAGQFATASEHFKRAVRADTTFALAYLRLSQAANWTGADWVAVRSAEAAVRHGGRLSEPQRLLASAWLAYVTGRGLDAEREFRELVATDPQNTDAWYHLGETIFHWGPMFGWHAADAREAFSRVLELDPGNVAAIVHLVRLATREGNPALVDQMSDKIARLGSDDDHVLEVRALRAWAAGDTAEQRRLLAEMRLLDAPTLWSIAVSLAANAGEPAAVRSLLPLLAPGPDLMAGDPGGHRQVRIFAALLEGASGRFAAAMDWIDSVEVIDPIKALEFRGILALHPVAHLDRPAIDRLRAQIETHRSPVADRAMTPLNQQQRPLLYGVLGARVGDAAAVRRALADLDAAEIFPSRLDVHMKRAEAIVRAEAALAAGDAEAALQAIERFPPDALDRLPVYDRDPEEAHLRWLRAETLTALGRDEEALRWYATFPNPAGNDILYLAPSHLRRAVIHERRGEWEHALIHYNQVLRLWRHADAAARPYLDEARRGAERAKRRLAER